MPGKEKRTRKPTFENEGESIRSEEHASQAPAEKPSPPGASGVASGLQPTGTTPGGMPGAIKGSIGTGGGSSPSTGNVKKSQRRQGADK